MWEKLNNLEPSEVAGIVIFAIVIVLVIIAYTNSRPGEFVNKLFHNQWH